MSQQTDWDVYSNLASSDVRREVAEAIHDGHTMPKEIHEETGIRWTHISRALNQLRDERIVELLVPEDTKKGRVHGVTDRGRRALELLQEREA